MEKAYNPGEIEKRWYACWLEADCFKGHAEPDREKFSVVIPPPNVTGVLTMGHVLNNTIQDILVRRARQSGKSVIWLPGTDHAGIATQTRVEAMLRDEGSSRQAIGRAAFLERACQWRDKHGGIIIDQLKKLGASCDWSRTVHTLDEGYSNAVLSAFVNLYESGHIYRGKRMVNWCPGSLTALSDEEVFWKKQNGILYKVRYEIVERPGEYITVSTTRPETIMGDTAIAVHPTDPRYSALIGLHVWRPLCREKILIIGDDAVLMDFGTGALKVTPAHDALDFQIGKRHNLEVRDIMNPDGTLNELAGPGFAGQERFAARKLAAEKLEELGALVAQEPYENQIGYSERANVPIEPRLSEQWFLKYPRIEQAKDVVRNGLIRFHPERWEKTYLYWLDNIQDWCISRQLWWGHRIPVWYKKGQPRANPANWHISLEGPADSENWEQDEDTLDTWFSSWLWPFATFGWPDADAMAKDGYNDWYPTSDLVTGPDIIFFWVARMIIAGLEFCGDGASPTLTESELRQRIPFKNVYFTGIIRDHLGRKMSKSLGNSPDPLDLISKYGADGLRFGIMSMAPHGQDVFFNESGIEQGRNFCNKLWNACRFRKMRSEGDDVSSWDAIINRLGAHQLGLDAEDHAILGQLLELTRQVHTSLDNYEFNTAVKTLQSFFWGDYCDWYLEVSKTRMGQSDSPVLAIQDLVLRQLLLLMHPFTPFITEELWHSMGFGKSDEFIQNMSPLTVAQIQEKLKAVGITPEGQAIEEVGHLREFVSHARALKAQYGLASKRDLNFTVKATETQWATIQKHELKLLGLIGGHSLKPSEARGDAPASVTPVGTLYLELVGAVDIPAEIARLEKEITKLEKGAAAGEAKLNSGTFREKAPAEIVAGAERELAATHAKLEE
ncbi:MAG TPA: valine--tRNA ligase, partial [Opitutales bacterium]|nr:valine--tRNA ligase [Opitutales bacterium]